MLYSRADYDAELDDFDKQDQQISKDVAHHVMTGLDSLKATADLERERRKAKGRLLATIGHIVDGNARSSCNYPKEHKKGCKCKRLYGSLKKPKATADGST